MPDEPPRSIGYYVHHHGDGHRRRALTLAHANPRIVLLGTGLAGRTGPIPAIDLPDDRRDARFDGRDGTRRPDALHYAPIDHAGVRDRVAAIARWIAGARPALMVIDVSAEIAMLARLAATPTVYVRLGGIRDDAAHRDAFRGATALLAPFHRDLDDPAVSDTVRARTRYAPGLIHRPAQTAVDEAMVLVVIGRGGDAPVHGDVWAAAARAVPERRWRVIGPCSPPADTPDNLALLGWVEDAAAMIAGAGIIIGGAGDGLVGTVLAARRPFVCLPEVRPYDEQVAKARALAACGAAIVCPHSPSAADWPDLLTRATALDPAAIARLDDKHGIDRTASWLSTLADRAITGRAMCV
jgi:hypothetical protein